jgi:GMP synthase (glutamine-hydrolysing)
MIDSIAILDFGSQYTQIIARRIREAQVYCEIFPWDAPQEKIESICPKAFILSGGPTSVYETNAPYIQDFILNAQMPVLGICYGMQAMTHQNGGEVIPSTHREYGHAEIEIIKDNPLVKPTDKKVWMSHGDRIDNPPPGFDIFARSENCPIAVMGNVQKKQYGVQFHPEVHHSPTGFEILKRFLFDICDIKPEWTPESIIQQSLEAIQKQVGSAKVLTAVSGGVDSSVATALVDRAIGEQLTAVFVDNGLLRKGEREQVEAAFRETMGTRLIVVDAEETFLKALESVTEPEAKRRIIGETFIRIFEEQARKLGHLPFLVQGTIYPDVVESSGTDSSKSKTIKSHHNVGGLPEDMSFELVEPLRYLFKDEVRLIGEALGLPSELVWRQPFPGPGLGVRCLGDLTKERLDRLREADSIFTSELIAAGLLHRKDARHKGISQAFAALLPVRSVGVMGDNRTYQEAVALRAVTTEDFMTADWAKIPHELLAKISSRIVNEVQGVNRVVYDITSKPPSTIEWE